MPDALKYGELDRSIESVISRGEFASTGDEELDALARVASGLRGLPTPEFRARLGAEFLPGAGRHAWWPFEKKTGAYEGAQPRRKQPTGVIAQIRGLLPAASWFRKQRAFAAAGGGCGLVASSCCISGAVANVFGLASAAAVSAFIQSTIPYFVGLSIITLLAWVAWRLRGQAITPGTVALTFRRHGIALGSSYGVVFGASMALAIAMGLY